VALLLSFLHRINNSQTVTPFPTASLRLRRRAILQDAGISTAQIAKATDLALGTVEQAIAGSRGGVKTLQRITDCCGFELFEGVKPRGTIISFDAGEGMELVGNEELAKQVEAENVGKCVREGAIITFTEAVSFRVAWNPDK